MKIVYNTDQISTHGGIEKVMSTKVNYLVNLPNTEVYIVTTEQQDKKPIYNIDPRVQLIDLKINYDRSKSYFSWHNLKKTYQHYTKQKKLYKSIKPNVVISPNFNFDHYWLPFIKQKAKLIKERHSSRYNENKQFRSANILKKIRFKLNDWIESLYDVIVVLNPDEKSYVRGNNAVVIPNPIESSELLANVEAKRVIAAGRISPVKNFGDLIEAWVQIKSDFPDWELHFYGDDYLGTKETLQKKINEEELQHVIHFKGSSSSMLQVMSEYSIYAMTSKTECFPTVLLEAMSIGLPVVTYDCPNGPRHIVDNGEDGVLVKDQHVDAMAAELKTMMRNTAERKRMQQNAKHNVKRFTTEEVMKQWLSLINLSHV